MTIWRLMMLVLWGCCLTGWLAGCDQPRLATSDSESKATTESSIVNELKLELKIDCSQAEQPGIETQYTHAGTELTVLDLLKNAGEQDGFVIAHSGAGETAFVKSINGIVGGEEGRGWWIYYVNKKLAHQGAGVFKLKDGDQVEWKLGTYKDDSSDDGDGETDSPD